MLALLLLPHTRAAPLLPQRARAVPLLPQRAVTAPTAVPSTAPAAPIATRSQRPCSAAPSTAPTAHSRAAPSTVPILHTRAAPSTRHTLVQAHLRLLAPPRACTAPSAALTATHLRYSCRSTLRTRSCAAARSRTNLAQTAPGDPACFRKHIPSVSTPSTPTPATTAATHTPELSQCYSHKRPHQALNKVYKKLHRETRLVFANRSPIWRRGYRTKPVLVLSTPAPSSAPNPHAHTHTHTTSLFHARHLPLLIHLGVLHKPACSAAGSSSSAWSAPRCFVRRC
jgi:hypothetical protein